jgi:hypothetical protein
MRQTTDLIKLRTAHQTRATIPAGNQPTKSIKNTSRGRSPEGSGGGLRIDSQSPIPYPKPVPSTRPDQIIRNPMKTPMHCPRTRNRNVVIRIRRRAIT